MKIGQKLTNLINHAFFKLGYPTIDKRQGTVSNFDTKFLNSILVIII